MDMHSEPSDFGTEFEDSDNGGYSSFSGRSTCAEEDYQVDLFNQDGDAVSFLEGMKSHHGDDADHTVQQFEIVRKRRRLALQKLDDSDGEEVDGGTQDEEQGDINMEEQEDMEEVQDVFEQKQRKIGINRKSSKRRPKTGEKGKPRRLEKKVKTKDEEFSRQMGEATFLFVNGKHEQAQGLCMQVIKRVPNSPEPYHTMGMILEADGNTKRALDFYMVAAHFTSKDVDLWKRLAGLSTEVGYLRQAIYCLTHVIRHNKHDIAPQWDRALLYAEVNELYKAANAFEEINKVRKGDPEVAKMLAKLYHRMGRVMKAIKLLESFVTEHEKSTDLTHINMLGELYLQQCNYTAASELINRTIRGALRDKPMPIDLEVKAGICAAHTGDMLKSDKHLRKLLSEAPEHCMDLFMEAGKNLLQLGYVDRASDFFEPLLKVPQAAGKELWSRLRECRVKTGGIAAVTQMYKEIVHSLPCDHEDYADHCLLMMEAMTEVGDREDAREALESLRLLIDQEKVFLPACNEEASSMLLRMEEIDLKVGQGESFLERMLPVVSASVKYISRDSIDTIDFSLPTDLHRAFTRQRRKQAPSSLLSDSGFESDSVFKGHINARRQKKYNRLVREGETDVEGEEEVKEGDGGLILKGILKQEDQFQILIKVIDALMEQRRESDACSILDSLVRVSGNATRLHDKIIRDRARLKLASVLMSTKEYRRAHDHIKILSSKHPYSITVWNMYSQAVGKLGTIKWLMRYVETVRGKHPSSTPVALMLGHVMSLRSYFSGALGEYFQVYKRLPEDPLVLLLIGVTYISLSMTSKMQNRHLAVLDGLAFLQQYGDQRENKHEFLYNMGRATHQIGLMHLAVHYYEQALATPPPVNEVGWNMEAAHNLIQIFKDSGAIGLARDVMIKHLTI